MTASTDFDRLLTSWLETAGPPDVIDDVVTAAFVETRTLPQRRAPWPIGPRSWPAAGTAAALPWRTILVAAALVVALAAALALVAGGPRPTPLGLSDSVAIVLRQPDGAVDTVDVIAVGADGTERLVRRFEPGDLGAGRRALPYGEVSLDGWFALALAGDTAASGSFALLRLDDPSRAPLFVDYVPVIGGAWSPTGGQFATTTPPHMQCCAITVTDATTGRSQDLGDVVLPGGGPSILWAPGRVGDRRAGRSHRPLGDLVADRGTIRPGCRVHGALDPAELDGAAVVARSFSADGTAVWGLYDEIRTGQHTAVLARSDGAESGREVVARVPLGENVTHLWFAGLDTADTRIAIGSWVGEDAVMQPIRIVETATGRSHLGRGQPHRLRARDLAGRARGCQRLARPHAVTGGVAPRARSGARGPRGPLGGRRDRWTLVRAVGTEAPDAADRPGARDRDGVRPARRPRILDRRHGSGDG